MTKLTKEDLALISAALRNHANDARRKEQGLRTIDEVTADEWKSEQEASVALIDKISHIRSDIEVEEVEKYFSG